MSNLEQFGKNEFMEPTMDSATAEYKEHEMVLHKAEVIAPEGLCFGEGSISAAAVEANLSDDEKAALNAAAESANFLIDITTESDGCGDGRAVNKVIENEVIVDTVNTRKKVFGGGAAMMTATLIGSGAAAGKNLTDTFTTAMHTMNENGMDFGAHTDNHAKGDICGCGAIDKAPTAIANIAKFQEEIRATMAKLGQDAEITDVVLKNFADYASEIAKNTEYTGASVMDKILRSGKMVKELADAHLEARVYLNFVPGKTVDQSYIRQITNNKAQAFSVDVWHMAEIATKTYPNDEIAQKISVASQVAYTLGVAATLTKGDIPVIKVKPVKVAEPVAVTA